MRAHACTGLCKAPGSEICMDCKYVRTLLLRKHKRRIVAAKRGIKKNTPLHTVSKLRIRKALKLIRKKARDSERKLKEIQAKLTQNEDMINVSKEAHDDLFQSMEKSCPANDFVKLFWSEQKKAFNRRNGGMRWHPMMLRLAILMHSQSPTLYRTIRNTGVLKLPCEATLRDYTNVVHPHSGFQIEVFQELKNMTKDLDENQRWICLMHDEISIKADLVYDKTTGELVGFVDTSQWNDKTQKDGHLASHALVFMVVGITSNIKMSIGYFPT